MKMKRMKTKQKIWFGAILLLLGIGIYAGVRVIRARALDRMIGQMILVGFRGTTPNDAEVKDIAADIRNGKIGGVILFDIDVAKAKAAGMSVAETRKQIQSRNIVDVAQVRVLNAYLQDAARTGNRPPILIAVDFEGGQIVRLLPEHGFVSTLPSEKDLAKSDTPEQVDEKFYDVGQSLRDIGFNLDFAPVVDVDINPASPAIGARGRSFSSDPQRVVAYAHSAADGLARAGVLYAFKHFPGHGSAGADTHLGLVDTTNTWRPSELAPYRELAKTDMPGMILVAHVTNKNLDDTFPASLSPKIVDGILREQLGYNGVVISDDLQMRAIYDHYEFRDTLKYAILAGIDIMLLNNNDIYTENLGRAAHKEIADMVRRGEIPRARIRESYDRIIKLKANISANKI
ncbi:MAG: glycoside hydrolase family 3 [Proteobacteria bacterium]|nr:glycoside hydrolase family 3 [Pseudomonadota bacterium]